MEETGLSSHDLDFEVSNETLSKSSQTDITWTDDSITVGAIKTSVGEPKNEGETQLFSVLQKANLLEYFDSFVSQGGDDVQQICEAGKEEFLEIVSLVGMSRKPLHVRRLQKALQDWVTNPHLFSVPEWPEAESQRSQIQSRNSIIDCSKPSTPQTFSTHQESNILNLCLNNNSISTQQPSIPTASNNLEVLPSPAASEEGSLISIFEQSPILQLAPTRLDFDSLTGNLTSSSLKRSLSVDLDRHSDGIFVVQNSEGSSDSSEMASSPIGTEFDYSLTDEEVNAIKETARILVDANQQARLNQPPKESSKTLHSKQNKRILKEIQDAMALQESDCKREIVFRKHSAIYGRFDSRRKPGRKLSPHESAINEASAQICLLDKTFLIRRDELFMLARQVLRDVGFQPKKSSGKSFRKQARKITSVDPNNWQSGCDVLSKFPRTEDEKCHKNLEVQTKFSNLERKIEDLNQRAPLTSQFERDMSILSSSLLAPEANTNSLFQAPENFSILNQPFNNQGFLGSYITSGLHPVNVSNFRSHFWPSATGNPELGFLQSALQASTNKPSINYSPAPKLEPLSP